MLNFDDRLNPIEVFNSLFKSNGKGGFDWFVFYDEDDGFLGWIILISKIDLGDFEWKLSRN